MSIDNLHRDYGWQGRLGLGTPQANPTVEAEMRRLFPVAVEYFTLRLTCPSSDPATRMSTYLTQLPQLVHSFAGMQLDGFLFACTASSYLLDAELEYAAIAATQSILHAPVITAAAALKHWFEQHGVNTIAMATPYPDWLYQPALHYWQQQGFNIIETARITIASDNTYGIYALNSQAAINYLDQLASSGADAIMVSGTGMPSLALLAMAQERNIPIVSSNYALAKAGLALVSAQPQPVTEWHLNQP